MKKKTAIALGIGGLVATAGVAAVFAWRARSKDDGDPVTIRSSPAGSPGPVATVMGPAPAPAPKGSSTSKKAINVGENVVAGAATGAALGSAIPVVGTAVGAGVGAAVGAVYSWLS